MTEDEKRVHKFKMSIHSMLVSMVEKYNGKLRVEKLPGLDVIQLIASYEFVPDIYLEWCGTGEYYRAYFCAGNTRLHKTTSGKYQFARVGSVHAAADLVLNFYGFIFNNRANNKQRS